MPRHPNPLFAVVIETGSNGLLFKPHDSADLGKETDWLFDRPERVRDMGRAGRRYAEGRSWPAVIDRLLDDYASIARVRLGIRFPSPIHRNGS